MYAHFHRATEPGNLPRLPAAYLQPRWYAAQTGANQEKQVESRLRDKGVESFVPQFRELRRRTDRKVIVQVPMFPGYVFVRIALRDRLQVLEVPRVVRLVGFGTAPTPIADRDIAGLRAGLAQSKATPYPRLCVGRRVRVIAGSFEGLEGVLVRRKSWLRVVVCIEAILRSFAVEVDENDIQPIGSGSVACR